MAGLFFMTRDGDIAKDIELEFDIRIMQVRGLTPSNPKPIFTRDWAEENGVDYYVGTARKVKQSEVIMTIYAKDYYATALQKYRNFHDWLLAETEPIHYRDLLQWRECDLIYDSNKPAWFDLLQGEANQLVAEITFINPTGLTTLAV